MMRYIIIKWCLTLWNPVKLAAACFIVHVTTSACCFLFGNGGRRGIIGVEGKLYGSLATASCMFYGIGRIPAFFHKSRDFVKNYEINVIKQHLRKPLLISEFE